MAILLKNISKYLWSLITWIVGIRNVNQSKPDYKLEKCTFAYTYFLKTQHLREKMSVWKKKYPLLNYTHYIQQLRCLYNYYNR